MKTFEISFNSRADFQRQISAFSEQHPTARIDETQINLAMARATKMDNDGEAVGERLIIQIGYSGMPLKP